ncbi:MAG: GNAT family N-acetyltransferase [Cellulophaga sp.]
MIQLDAIKIEKLVLEDAKSLSDLMVSNTERFNRFFPQTLAQNLSVSDSETYILLKNEEIRTRSEFTFAIRENNSASIIGLIILKRLDWEKKIGELAYCIDVKSKGKGWMTKIVKVFSIYAFEKLGLETLQIIVHKTNIGSLKVAEKCNFKWQTVLKKEHTPPGEKPLDMELYELNR